MSTPSPTDAPHDAAALERAERQGRVLAELGAIGMDLARALRDRVVGAADGGWEPAEAAMAFSRLSRAVRLTLALETRLAEEHRTRAEAAAAEQAAQAARALEARIKARRDRLTDAIELALEAEAAGRAGAAGRFDDDADGAGDADEGDAYGRDGHDPDAYGRETYGRDAYGEDEDGETPDRERLGAGLQALLWALDERVTAAGEDPRFLERPFGELVNHVRRELGLAPDPTVWDEDGWPAREPPPAPAAGPSPHASPPGASLPQASLPGASHPGAPYPGAAPPWRRPPRSEPS